MKKLLPFLFFLISCNANRDHWTLKSYDKDEGYVFEKNGVEYRASCSGTGSPVLGPASNIRPDTDPEAVPPNPAEDESACGEILRYLHKPIPNFKLVGSRTTLRREELSAGVRNQRCKVAQS